MEYVVPFDSLWRRYSDEHASGIGWLDSHLRENDVIGAGNDGRWVCGLGSIRRDESNGTEEIAV